MASALVRSLLPIHRMKPRRRDLGELRGVSILVVDDDPAVGCAVARLLASAGASVRRAETGAQAVSLVATEGVELLLTDVDMPCGDGPEVARAVVELEPHVVVVFMSGRPHDMHVATGKLAPTDHCMLKPFTPKHLVATLSATLADRRAS